MHELVQQLFGYLKRFAQIQSLPVVHGLGKHRKLFLLLEVRYDPKVRRLPPLRHWLHHFVRDRNVNQLCCRKGAARSVREFDNESQGHSNNLYNLPQIAVLVRLADCDSLRIDLPSQSRKQPLFFATQSSEAKKRVFGYQWKQRCTTASHNFIATS